MNLIPNLRKCAFCNKEAIHYYSIFARIDDTGTIIDSILPLCPTHKASEKLPDITGMTKQEVLVYQIMCS